MHTSQPLSPDDPDENHVAGLADGAWFIIRFSISQIGDRGAWRRWLRAKQRAAKRQFLSPRPVRQEPELPDAHETCWQNVKQKTPDELDRGQRHRFGLVAVGIVLPQKGHLPVCNRKDPAVGDCYPMRVARQILQNHLGSAEWWLGMDNPLDLFRLAAHRFERSGFSQTGHLSMEA